MTGWTEVTLGLQAMDEHKPLSDKGEMPQAVLTPDNVGNSTDAPTNPTDYQKQFAALWQA